MKVKAYHVTGRQLLKDAEGNWFEENIDSVTADVKEFRKTRGGIVIGELACEPVTAEFAVSDEMLASAEITPYVARKRKKNEGEGEYIPHIAE